MEADKEELYLEQRARENWIKYEDRNKTFFTIVLLVEKIRNMIRKLENGNGGWVNRQQDLMLLATNYFQSLFSALQVVDCGNLM